ncbi:HU family DNA-binding protein [Undibacterium arcticum]
MKKIATKHELSKAEAARIIATITETIVATVKKGDTVAIVGFGTFRQVSRAARAGFNPSKGTKNQDSGPKKSRSSCQAQASGMLSTRRQRSAER